LPVKDHGEATAFSVFRRAVALPPGSSPESPNAIIFAQNSELSNSFCRHDFRHAAGARMLRIYVIYWKTNLEAGGHLVESTIQIIKEAAETL
jgi:hypothetical protein